MNTLSAPFPWFGGKRKVAKEVWSRFGDVNNYVEPFFGSGAVLLGRPYVKGSETINDLDGYVANFWRALKHAPEETAEYADWPVNENDLHARHIWLVQQRETLRSKLEGNPEFYDAKIAGWWVWGICCWIGGGFCSGKGPWRTDNDGRLVRLDSNEQDSESIERRRIRIGDTGIRRRLIHLSGNGQGINGQGINAFSSLSVDKWFQLLSNRLRSARVASGDWTRVVSHSATTVLGMTGVFLDPPYADTAGRDPDIYSEDSQTVAHSVREWAIANGDDPLMRIALCGYEGEHQMPDSWGKFEWNAGSGYGGRAQERTHNGKRERIWFSPACVSVARWHKLF